MRKTYLFATDTSKFTREAFMSVYPLLSLSSKTILPELYSKRENIGQIDVYVDSEIGLDILQQLEKDFGKKVVYHLNFELTPLSMVNKLTGLKAEMRTNIIKYHKRDKSFFSGKSSVKYWEG